MKTLKYALRFLVRSKSYTLINLLGLAFSLACSIILMRYIHRELTVDTHCVDREKVYITKISMEGSEHIGGITGYKYDPVKLDKSQIEIQSHFNSLEDDYLLLNGHRFPSRTIVTDSAFFQLFHYPLLQGKVSLDKPTSVLLMKDFAKKLFGKANPIGKTIQYSNGKELIVEGVLDQPSCKSSIQFDMVLSRHLSTQWERMVTELYRFLPSTDIETMNEVGSKPRYLNNPQWDTRQFTFSFVPIQETYWHSEWQDQKTMFLCGEKSHLYILSGVCLLLLLTGILNFVNIYLMCMLRRGKEYGLKKVYGANKSIMFLQIWLENLLLTASALLIAWFIIEVTQIPVSHLLNTQITYISFDCWLSLSILLLLPIITSIYPFVKYSVNSPIHSIQSIGWSSRSVRSRMVFLGIQYVLTFIITVCALYYNNQLSLMLNTNPGFQTQDIIAVKLIYSSQDYSEFNEEKYQQENIRNKAIAEKLKGCPVIENIEPVWDKITERAYESNYITPKGEKVLLARRLVSPSFFKMFNIGLEEGTIPENNEKRCYIINRAAMKALQFSSLEDASLIEENRYRRNKNTPYHPIIAIAKDHYGGHLSMGAQPTVYEVGKFGRESVYIAYQEGRLQDLLEYLRGIMKEFYGTETVEYSILDEEVKAIYQEDRKIAGIYNIFAVIAIAVSCLGLFGISLFDIRQRYREIAIRKVNGAGLKDLYRLLFKKYLLVLVASFVVAAPLAYYLIYRYTADFAVKAPISIGIFALALLLISLISMGTLWWQIRKAANIDPATVMKTE
ncbi:MAG: ABC transporter permease [Bacteroides sp.]|nr:ABC transporter permease [Bacteroides sp.]